MKSIRHQLTLSLWIATGLLLLLGGLAIFLATRQILLSQFDATLIAKAQALTTAAEIDDDDFEIDLTIQDFAGFGAGAGGDYFEIRRADGRLLMRSPSLRKDRLPPLPVPVSEEPLIRSIHLEDGRPARVLAKRFAPTDDEDREYQDLHIIVASVNSELRGAFRVLGAVLLVTGAAALTLTGPLVRLGLRRGLKPLDHLAARVQSIGPDQLHERIDDTGLPPELKPVAGRLNGLLERLEESFDRERRFSSHAAHELRTPLAELRAMAEMGATWPDEATPDRSREMLGIVDELTALLEKLSLLARTDAGRQPVKPGPLHLPTALQSAISRHADDAAARRIEVRTDCADAELITDPVLFSTILTNLLGNAISHAPPGSTVSVWLSPARLIVENPAPDLENRDIGHLFERFWRKDKARSHHEHSGLGLSIVKACAALLGTICHAALSPEKIFRVEILWKPL